MIYENLEFFNVDHVDKVPGMNGVRLERFPQQFRHELGIKENHNGRFRAERVHGCEIRFVTEARYFDMALTAVEADIEICIYFGDMLHQKNTLKAGVCTVLHVERPVIYDIIEEEQLPHGRFAPNVWRIQFGMNGYLYFNYLDTFGYSRRPPVLEEKPALLWAAYGSSITCGSVTNLYSNCYLEQTAQRLGVEVWNKGLSGSCLCENFAADYMAQVPADMVSLEIGVNMVVPFDKEEFEKRVVYFLNRMKDSKARRIYVIDQFVNKGLIMKNHQEPYYRNYREFRRIVKERMEKIEDPRFIHIPGDQIACDITFLSTDILHPSDWGHIQMGERLAAWIRKEEEKRGEDRIGIL